MEESKEWGKECKKKTGNCLERGVGCVGSAPAYWTIKEKTIILQVQIFGERGGSAQRTINQNIDQHIVHTILLSSAIMIYIPANMFLFGFSVLDFFCRLVTKCQL
jgi:hypothetical protein